METLTTFILPLLIAIITTLLYETKRTKPCPKAPSIPDPIPFISNTYLSLTNLPAFQAKVSFFQRTSSNVLTYRLGPKNVYIVQGADNVSPLMRVTNDTGSCDGSRKAMQLANALTFQKDVENPHHDWLDLSNCTIYMLKTCFPSQVRHSSEAFIVGILAPLGFDSSDIKKFARDTSSRLKKGSAWSDTPSHERVWYGLHKVYEEWMTRKKFSYSMAGKYLDDFESRLENKFPVGEYVEGNVFQFLKDEMGAASLVAMCGPRLLNMNGGRKFVDLAWEYDAIAFYILTGAPRWWDRKPFEVSDKFLEAVGRWVEDGWKKFDWDTEADWEEKFGSRFSREMIKWFLHDAKMSMKSARGWMGFVIFALISNTVPITTWALYEIIRDPVLLGEVREEVLTVFEGRTLNTANLLGLPLRIRQGFILGDTIFPKGYLVQAMVTAAHRDEKTWSAEGHPAGKFWAQRHVKSVIKGAPGEGERLIPEFDVAGKRGSFMSFGGGSGMCPGRFIAKQEILMALATMIARFDVEFVEWTTLDGGKASDRAARDDPRYDGTIVVPPDREVK
ncbi:cytochrome P450, partial [Podospora australis]